MIQAAHVSNRVPNAWDYLGMVNILSHDLTEEGDPGYNQSVGGWSPGAASVGYQGGSLYTGPGLSVTQVMMNAAINNANAHSVSAQFDGAVTFGFGKNFGHGAIYSGEAGVTTDIGYGATFDVLSVTFFDDPNGSANSGGTSGVATVAPAATVPNGVQPGNPNLQPATPNSTATENVTLTFRAADLPGGSLAEKRQPIAGVVPTKVTISTAPSF